MVAVTVRTTVGGAEFVVEFDRTADECWTVIWPAFADRPDTKYRSLEAALSAVAEFIGKTEF